MLPCPPSARSAGVTIILSCVGLTYVVGRLAPFHCACELAMKLLPAIARVSWLALVTSARIWPGLTRSIAGVGFWPGAAISNVAALDIPPPGAGLSTVTPACPGCAMSAVLTCIVSWVALTNVVGRLAPFHCACELAIKFTPLIVSVSAAPPAGAEAGPSVSIDGTGFWPGAVIVNGNALDIPPPGAGLTTAIFTAPAATISAAPICAVSLVLLTKLVGRALPAHCT